MTLQELIDQECSRVINEVCGARYLRKSDVLSRSTKAYVVAARRDICRILFMNGFRKADIARALGRNHSMIKYWLDDKTRTRRRMLAHEYAKQRRGNCHEFLRCVEGVA